MKLLVCLTPLVSLVVCQSTNLQQNNPYRQDGTNCFVRGTKYNAGQGYQSLDGCNTCKCNPSGEDVCTRMSCASNYEYKKLTDTNQCVVGGQTYMLGQEYPSPDGCNTCTCNPTGSDSCTFKACSTMFGNTGGSSSNSNNWSRTPGSGGSWNMGGNSNSNSWMNDFYSWFNNWMMSNPNWMSGFGNNYKSSSQDTMNRFQNWLMNQWMNQNRNIWSNWNNNQGNNYEAMQQTFKNRIMADFINYINGGNSNSNWNSNSWNWNWNNNSNRNWNRNWDQNQMRFGNNFGNNMDRNWNGVYNNFGNSMMRQNNDWNNWNRNYGQQRMGSGYNMYDDRFGNSYNNRYDNSWMSPNRFDNSMRSYNRMDDFGFGMRSNNNDWNNWNRNYGPQRMDSRFNQYDNRFGNSYNNRYDNSWMGDNRYDNSMRSYNRMNDFGNSNNNNWNRNGNMANWNTIGNNMKFNTQGFFPANFNDQDVQKAYSFVEAHTNRVWDQPQQLIASSAERIYKKDQAMDGTTIYRFEKLEFYPTTCPRDRSSQYERMPWMGRSKSECKPSSLRPTAVCDATVTWNPNGNPQYQLSDYRKCT